MTSLGEVRCTASKTAANRAKKTRVTDGARSFLYEVFEVQE